MSLAGMDNPLKDAFARPRQDMLLSFVQDEAAGL
jgi:hypothetical protein